MLQETVGYSCKYTPIELLEALGANPTLIDGEVDDFEKAEAATHSNLCCHVKAILQLGAEFDNVVVCDCCDSFRRAYDVMAYRGRHAFIHLMDLPHEANECSKDRLLMEIRSLIKAWSDYSGNELKPERLLQACLKERERIGADHFDSVALSAITQPFYAVVGARVSPQLMALIRSSLDLPVVNLTCNGNRVLEASPQDADTYDLEELLDWYAGALLRMTPCMRMADVSGRRMLTEHPQLAGVVYNTVKFCDFYGFDYAAMQEQVSVPILKIESDYMPSPSGQLSTRLEAFMESVRGDAGSPVNAPSSLNADKPEDTDSSDNALPITEKGPNSLASQTSRPQTQTRGSRTYYAGIDSGSTSTNMVVLDDEGRVVASSIVRTGAKAENGARAAFDAVKEQLHIGNDDFASIVATGYGRANIPFATRTVTEITCHAKGAHYLNPEIRTIVDIGGQDSKVIVLDQTGSVANFVMNDKCAAGTGRFLEAMARTLEIDLEAMSKSGLNWKKDLSISSMCTVFAESEVISLIADNHSEPDIIHGLNKSIASRTASMVSRAKGEAPYMMTGGVARNAGVVKELSSRLGEDLFITENPDLCGALGAALFAYEAA